MSMSKTKVGLAWLFAALIALLCVPGAAFAAEGDIAVHVQYGGEPTYQDAKTTVGTVTGADLASIAAKHTDAYGYALNAKKTLSSVAVTKYVTLDELVGAVEGASFEEGDTLYFGTSDGEVYQKAHFTYADLNAKRSFYPAMTADACTAEGAIEVPAAFALEYGSAEIKTTAAAAFDDAKASAKPTSLARFFVGMTEAKTDAVTPGASTPSGIDSIYIVKPGDFVVYEVANGEKTPVKGYTKAALEKLASEDAAGKGWLFYKNGWQVGVSTKYIPLETLLSDAYSKSFALDKQQRIVAIADDGFNTTLSYSQINDSTKFYPATGADSQSTDGAVDVGTVLALNWNTTAVSDTAGNTVKAVAADPSKLKDELRIFTGLNEDDYKNKAAAGNRFATGPIELDVVTPADMSSAEVTGLADSYTYQGDDFIPQFKVVLGGKELSVQTSKKNFGEDCVASVKWDTTAMSGTLTIKGQNSYSGSITKTLTLAKASLKEAVISGVADAAWTGKAINPEVTVTLNGKALEAGSDYAIEYGANTAPGEGTVTVKPGENGLFTDSASATFKITRDITGATVTLSKGSVAYTGKAQTSDVTAVTLSDGTKLAPADFDAVAAKGTNVGSYQAEVVAKGAYTGKAAAAFTIAQAANSAVAKSAKVAKTVTAKSLKKKAATVALPKVTVKFGKAAWTVAAKDKKKVLSLKNGKIQVKKGAKAGKYTIKVKAGVAKTANYNSASTKTVTVKVTVK